MSGRRSIRPSAVVDGVVEYSTPSHGAPVDLCLDKNEGATPPASLLDEISESGVDLLRRYTDARSLESRIARGVGLDAERVIVTAGGDDAIARALRAVLEPGREIVMPVPTFEMIGRYASLAGAKIVEVAWTDGPYPVEEVIGRVNGRTAAISVVTPNNPTGLVATADDIRRLSEAAPGALILVDLAYVEFADCDLTEAALALPNAVVIRTFSKAWGLAGLRVGWAAGPADMISWMRASGNPYAVSSASLAIAEAMLASGGGVGEYVVRVRREVREASGLLERLGAQVLPSQANFVLARVKDAGWLRDALAGLGIAVRIFPGQPGLEGCARITMPGDDASFARLADALEAALAPEAILFDIDDTLADVTDSYRRAIVATAGAFGAVVTNDDIARAKAGGDANNDWELTLSLIRGAGIEANMGEVTERFEELYQGSGGAPGYKESERLTIDRGLLAELAKRFKLGIVTGRPRSDAEEFLEREGISGLFGAVVAMEDGPLKPDPAPVRIALERLGVSRAWMVGDTPDDMRAARSAGVVPVGVVAPSEDPKAAGRALIASGASRVLEDVNGIKEII